MYERQGRVAEIVGPPPLIVAATCSRVDLIDIRPLEARGRARNMLNRLVAIAANGTASTYAGKLIDIGKQ